MRAVAISSLKLVPPLGSGLTPLVPTVADVVADLDATAGGGETTGLPADLAASELLPWTAAVRLAGNVRLR